MRHLVPLVLVATLAAAEESAPTFGDDVAFLREHVDVHLLEDGDAKVALVPAYQGRVMTSTAGGDAGASHGWINREPIASGEAQPQIHVFGGEDRFWLGPEGGQYAIFFPPGTGDGETFVYSDWKTPAPIDTMPYELEAGDATRAKFTAAFDLTNWSGTGFSCEVIRTVSLLDRATVAEALGREIGDGIRMVAYQSDNRLINAGEEAWTEEGGLLSIWILGMYKPSPRTTVVIPFETGSIAERGPIVNDEYFGKVPDERLAVDADEGLIYFSGDGRLRSKIGVGPQRAKRILGSWDAEGGVLTLVTYTKPDGATDYVNSMWELQEKPYGGDVVNSYNDGPPEPGAEPLGPFYELETSSPAAALAPGEFIRHVHRTIHLAGEREALDGIARDVLGTSLDAIEAALPE